MYLNLTALNGRVFVFFAGPSFEDREECFEINLTTESIWTPITAGCRRDVAAWTKRVVLEETVRFEHEC